MMFGQYPEDIQQGDAHAAANPYDPNPTAGFFQGAASDVIPSIQRGLTEGSLLMGEGLAPALRPLEESQLGMSDADYDDAVKDWRNNNLNSIAALEPDPHTVGALGRVAGSLTEVVPSAVAGGVLGGPIGAAAAFGSTKGVQDFRLGQQQGLDTPTALEKGGLTAATSAASMLVPVGFGAGLMAKMATGAGTNIIMGAGEREGSAAILRANGYGDMADQYKPLDAASVASDGVLGLFFGALAKLHGHTPEDVKPSDVDAALLAKNVQNLEVDSAPGIPIDPATRDTHVNTMKTVQEQLLTGSPVDTSGINEDLHFFQHDPISEAEASKLFSDSLRGMFPEHADIIEAGEKPPAPSLIKFLADRGGINDENGELEALNAQDWHKDKPFQKMLIKEDGDHPDDATLAAHEAGYLQGDERPTPNDLYDAIDHELRGNKIYPHGWTPEDAYDRDLDEHQRASMEQENIPEQPQLSSSRENDILAQKPDMMIVGENGEPARAADILASSDKEIEDAKGSGDLFQAAINCFMKWG